MFYTMTAFTTADLPTSIDKVEEVCAWSTYLLHTLYTTQTRVEGAGAPVRVANFGLFDVQENNTKIVICRTSFVLSPDFGVRGEKIWNAVQTMGTAAIPANFKSN